MAPSRRSRAASDPASSGWSSSLRPPLDLKPALLPEDVDDDRAVAELLVAALEGDLTRAKKLAKELRKKGMGVDEAVAAADVGVTGIKRRGPLHLAAANGKADLCKFLISSCEVDVDATDGDGATPLIFAVQGVGSIPTIKLLLSRGADPNKTDSIGVAPLHIAAERGSYEIAELLLSKEVEIDPICERFGAPIHVSAQNGHGRMLKLLLQHQADANIPDENGKLPVQIAACQGWKECVKILFPATTPVADYEEWSVDGIIQHETPLNSDDKENADSDSNNKDTLPPSENGAALTTEEHALYSNDELEHFLVDWINNPDTIGPIEVVQVANLYPIDELRRNGEKELYFLTELEKFGEGKLKRAYNGCKWKNSYEKDKDKEGHLTKRFHYQLYINQQLVNDVSLTEFIKKDGPKNKVLYKFTFTGPEATNALPNEDDSRAQEVQEGISYDTGVEGSAREKEEAQSLQILRDMGDELVSLADKLEAAPPRITMAESISALRRLARRAKDGVRASCRGTGDAPIPPPETSWPGWTPETHGTSPPDRSSRRTRKRIRSESPAKQPKQSRKEITEDPPNASTSNLDHAMSQPSDATDADAAAAMDPSPSPSPSAPPPPPPVVEWPKGGALTRDWVTGLESVLNWSSRHLPADRLPEMLPSALVESLVLAATTILCREPNLVRVKLVPAQSVVVVGDVHGQLHDVMFLLRDAGFPSEERVFVFNGDYVDRGAWGLETLLLLLAWKVLLPNCVFLLRGNHESKYCTSVYGFEQEVLTKYKEQGHDIYEKFINCFKGLPLATIIAGCVYTAHGGIFRETVVSPSKKSKKGRRKGRKNKAVVDPTSLRLGSLDQLLEARRNADDPGTTCHSLIPGDVLWSDPSLEIGLALNEERGIGLLWGPDITEQFLRTNNLKLIIRSHEGPDARDKRYDLLGMDKGYTVDHDVECGKLITLFSAPDYPQFQASEERYNNRGAYIVLNPPDYATPDFHSFEAVKPRPQARPFYDFEGVRDSDEELDLDAMDSGTLSQ